MKVIQSSLTLCKPRECILPVSVLGILQAGILEGVPHFLLDQGLNPGPLHCRQILHSLSHQGPLWFSKSSFYSLGSLVT